MSRLPRLCDLPYTMLLAQGLKDTKRQHMIGTARRRMSMQLQDMSTQYDSSHNPTGWFLQ